MKSSEKKKLGTKLTTYETRCEKMDINSHAKRRSSGDLIQFYKIAQNTDDWLYIGPLQKSYFKIYYPILAATTDHMHMTLNLFKLTTIFCYY